MATATPAPVAQHPPAPSPGRVRAAVAEAAAGSSKWPFLDGARGVAIAAVVIFHALRIGGGWGSEKILTEGVPPGLWAVGVFRFAIDLFFVLSGFLITYTWWNRRRHHPRLRPALREYVRARAFRVLPVFWVSLLVLIPLRAPELLATPAGWADIGLFVTVQQYFDRALTEHVNVVTWSLTTEVHFYVLLPLLAALAARRLGLRVLVAGALALSVFWAAARGEYSLSLLPGRLDQFMMGMAVASAYRAGGGRMTRLVAARGMGWAMGLGLFALGTYHGVLLGIPQDRWLDHVLHPLAGILLAGLLLRLLTVERPLAMRSALEHPVWLVLGAASYSLYLWHVPLLEVAVDLFQPFATGLGLVTGVALSLAATAVSYTWVERPFMARKAPAPSPPAPAPLGEKTLQVA